jgi:hypothetical protein
MKSVLYIFLIIFCIGCNKGQKTNSNPTNLDTIIVKKSDTLTVKTKPVVGKRIKLIQFTDKQLEAFLDSIGNKSTKIWIEKVSFYSDSIFKNRQQLDQAIDKSDFNKLKKACKNGINDPEFKEFKPAYRIGKLDLVTAKRIFKYTQIEDEYYYRKDTLYINFIPFDSNKFDFNEFAIYLGNPYNTEECDLYFFKSNKIISKHHIYHRYGLEIKHYIDTDGKTVIYYKENYESGSGIWWFNYYFYKYFDNKLIPILNQLENTNLQYSWGFRVLWFESIIQNTNPLTIKMVYYQKLSDTSGVHIKIIDDSTYVQYYWDEKSKTLIGDYQKSKLSKQQILAYYITVDNEIIFINSYYKTLKACLNKKNIKKREVTLHYLNLVKNYYSNYR